MSKNPDPRSYSNVEQNIVFIMILDLGSWTLDRFLTPQMLNNYDCEKQLQKVVNLQISRR